MIGTTISHYRVVSLIGAGGMGVVYQAEDLRLGRAVALKFLPLDGGDATAIGRFEREARTACALSHPGICTIYEVDEHEGRPFIAMELVDGKTLTQHVNGSPLPINQLLELGIQIADALDAAHSHGILHRDIKPGNIFVTRRHQAKLLDFGLAKFVAERHQPDTDEARSTEVLSTKTGMVVGTIAYMSPEQARGEELDARTDLFSFGLVLYEMATGRQTFGGPTTAVVFDAILNRAPSTPSRLNPALPPAVDQIINRLLEKDRRLRYQTAADVRADLQRLKRDFESGRHETLSVQSTGTSQHASTGAAPAATGTAPARSGMLQSLQANRGLSAVLLGGAAVLIAALVAVAYLIGRLSNIAAPSASSPAAVAPTPQPAQQKSPVAAIQPQASPPALPSQATEPTPSAAVVPAPAAAPAPAKPTQASRKPTAATPPPASVEAPAPTGSPTPERDRAAAAAESESRESLQIAHSKLAAKLFDQAIADARAIVARHPTGPVAYDAYQLIALSHQHAGRHDETMATLVEIINRFKADSRRPGALMQLVQVTMQSRRADRNAEARKYLTELITAHPTSPLATRALQMRAQLEDRDRIRETDPTLGGNVAASLRSYRLLAERGGNGPAAEEALLKLAEAYEDLRRYDLAASAHTELATRFPERHGNSWFKAGDIYEKKLRDAARARDAYSRVPPGSSAHRDAQRKLERLGR